MSELPTLPAGHGLYVFCVTRDGTACPDEAGLEPDSKVFGISHAGLTAVCCEIALDAWVGAASEANLRDLAWLGPRAVQHERVIEQAMGGGAVMPLRFGCIFSSAAGLHGWMAQHGGVIAKFLTELAGRQEWSIKGWLDAERAATALAADDPRIKALPASPGARYLREQKIKQELQRSVRQWARATGQDVLTSLQPLCERHRALDALPGSASGREEEVAFHHALLLAEERAESLHAEVARLNAALSGRGLTLAVTGPWPPYSFCPAISPPPEPDAAQGADAGPG